jgi:hypothetical protein
MFSIPTILLSILGKQNAYLDPGSGSFLLQLLIAGLLGLGVAVKVYWNKVKGLFGGKANTQQETEEENEDKIDLS